MIDYVRAGPEPRSQPLRLLKVSLPFTFLALPILLVSFALAVCGRGAVDLGLDEAVSFFVAHRPLLEIVKYTIVHVYEHPPGYYLLLNVWMTATGTSEFALRSLSAVADVLSVALLATLSRRWFGPRIALLAALLMALQPLAIGFGHTVRMYSWLVALSLLQLYLLVRAIERNRWRDWLLFLVVMLAAISVPYLAATGLIAYALFLAFRWRQLAACRWRFLAVLAILIGAPLAWVALVPGPRQAFMDLLQNTLRASWRADGLRTVYVEWSLGSSLEDLPRWLVFVMATIPWLLFAAGIASMARPRRWERRDLQLLLALVVILPPFAGTLLLSVVVFEQAGPSRHHSAMLGCFVLGVALGIDALVRYRRAVGVLALTGFVALSAFLVRDVIGGGGWRPYSPAMDYITARSQSDDKLAFTYFFDWVQASYYGPPGVSIAFVPGNDTPLTADQADDVARSTIGDGRAIWLVVYPTASRSAEVIEQSFNRLAFPAGKASFLGGRDVVQYFGPRPMTGHATAMTWDAGMRLEKWESSAPTVAAGDALRLIFNWGQTQPVGQRVLVSLGLYGADGLPWAKRIGEPCSGWCVTTQWGAKPVSDRLSFYIPPDTPPGDYTLRLGWLTPEGTPIMGRTADTSTAQVDLPLMTVHVDRPVDPLPSAAPDGRSRDVAFGPGLTLYAAAFANPTVRAGSTFVVPTQWQVSGPQPALTARLHLRQQAGQDITADSPLGPDWYPTEAWATGRIVRAQPRFSLPGTLAPGEYEASLSLVDPDGKEQAGRAPLGTLTVPDRPHRFEMPAQGVAVDVEWEEGIRLARAELPPKAAAGGSAPVTLIWQAGRPTGGNWKVFVHLVGPDGKTVAQNDAYPASDQALTPTWQTDEIIVDTHTLNLPATLPAGSYQVQVGLYDEKTGARLARSGGGDTYLLAAPLQVTAP